MREFNLYIDVSNAGKMNEPQREQFGIIINTLLDRRVNLYWLVEGNHLKARQMVNILRNVHAACKEKSIIVHNEICTVNKSYSMIARLLMKHLPITPYTDERIDKEDYVRLKHGNSPNGCIFNSCLGKTIYLRKDAQLSVCPHVNDVDLKCLKANEPVTEAFESDSFKSFLLRQIRKRDKCKNSCQYFALCHGGCPIQNDEEECPVCKKINETTSLKEEHEQRIIHLAELYRG